MTYSAAATANASHVNVKGPARNAMACMGTKNTA
jgi:hypothetical protein